MHSSAGGGAECRTTQSAARHARGDLSPRGIPGGTLTLVHAAAGELPLDHHRGSRMEEELEHVPWADLMAESEPEDRRRRAVYLGAAIVGAMVLGVIVARTWWAAPAMPTPVAP